MHQKEVFVCKTSPATLSRGIERILELSRLTSHYDAGKTTLVKVNANYDRFYPGCNTSPWFLDASLSALKNFGFSDLAVVEGDLKLQPAERTMWAAGLKEMLEKHGVPFINLDRSCYDDGAY